MRFSVVALSFMAISVNMILALEQPKQPLVVAGDVKPDRGRPDTDNWEDHNDHDHDHHGHNNGHGHENNGHGHNGNEHNGHHGSNECEWEEHNTKCRRKYPLTKRGPFQVSYEYQKHQLVPDLLDSPPTQYLEVEYRNHSQHHCQPELGNELNICGTTQQPRLRWKCDPKKLYTIIFVDVNPYGLKHKELGQFGILWLLVDVPGCRVSHGKTIFEYQLPTPLYGAIGPTRYTFLVYEQPAYKIDWSEEPRVGSKSFSHRFFRCINDLVRKYELILLAGNFYYTEYAPCIQPYINAISVPPYLERARVASESPPNPYA